jgi:hypothetical protein
MPWREGQGSPASRAGTCGTPLTPWPRSSTWRPSAPPQTFVGADPAPRLPDRATSPFALCAPAHRRHDRGEAVAVVASSGGNLVVWPAIVRLGLVSTLIVVVFSVSSPILSAQSVAHGQPSFPKCQLAYQGLSGRNHRQFTNSWTRRAAHVLWFPNGSRLVDLAVRIAALNVTSER